MQNPDYDFCPRCGALMYKGVCKSCEDAIRNMHHLYSTPIGQPNQQMNQNSYQNYGYTQNGAPYDMYRTAQPKKKHTGLIIGIVIGGGVLLIALAVLAICFFSYFLQNIETAAKNEASYDFDYDYDDEYDYDFDYDYDDDYDYAFDYDYDFDYDFDDDYNYDFDYDYEDDYIFDYDEEEDYTEDDETSEWIDLDGDGVGELEYSPGVEGLNAEVYEEITDYIRYDLSYSVEFFQYTDDDGKVECYYPYLEGNQEFIAKYNQLFYTIATETEDITDTNNCEGESTAYVTYMDEELLSVVFVEAYTFADGSSYEDILCFNIDMITGELIDIDLTDISDEFLSELEVRCREQGTSQADYLFDSYSKDEWKGILDNQEYAFVKFFTPIGMEFGITYDGCWCCSTFKDYEKYVTISDDNIDL